MYVTLKERAIEALNASKCSEKATYAAMIQGMESIQDPEGPVLLKNGMLVISEKCTRANPIAYLDSLANNGFPDKVCILEYPAGLDAGGLTQQFLATLLAACLDKKLFFINDIGVPQPVKPSDKEHLKTMGRLFNQLEIKNKALVDNFLTGELFGVPFYYLVKRCIEQPEISDEELLKAVALKSLEDPALAVPAKLLLNPNDEACIQAYMDLGLVETEEECLASAKEYFAGYVEGIRAFSEVLDPQVRGLFSSKTPEELQVHFQGEPCTVEALLAALKIDETVQHPPPPSFTQKIEWLKEKIRSSDLEWRKRFVAAITGNQTLSPGKKISLSASKTPETFLFHTCFASLEIPIEDMDEEAFLLGLEHSLKGSEFNTM